MEIVANNVIIGTFDYERLNPDLFAPPGTDAGDVPNAVWPLGLSHNRLGSQPGAGWARQQNTEVLPAAKAMAGVDMRLAPNAYRELHWHTAGEWALLLKGCVRVAAIDDESQSFFVVFCAGDVWFFPPGIPHSIQAFGNGSEFLLVFDQGDFSEDGTCSISETFLRNPIEVLSKDLRADVSAFDNLPKDQLYVSHMNLGIYPMPAYSISTQDSPSLDLQWNTSPGEHIRTEHHRIRGCHHRQRVIHIPLVPASTLPDPWWFRQDSGSEHVPHCKDVLRGPGGCPARSHARDPLAHHLG